MSQRPDKHLLYASMTDEQWLLVHKYTPLIRRVCVRYHLEDVEHPTVVDAALVAVKVWDGVRRIEPLIRKYASLAAMNVRRTCQNYDRAIDGYSTEARTEEPDPRIELAEREELTVLSHIVKHDTCEEDRILIYMRYWLDMTYEEIGQVIGTRKGRAFRMVRTAVDRVAMTLLKERGSHVNNL